MAVDRRIAGGLKCGAYPMSCVSSAAEAKPPKKRNVGSKAGQMAVCDWSVISLAHKLVQLKRKNHRAAQACDGPAAISLAAVRRDVQFVLH